MVWDFRSRKMPDREQLTDRSKKMTWYDLAVSVWSYVSLGLNIATHILIILACIKYLRKK